MQLVYSTAPADWAIHYTELNVKVVLFQIIQFSISMQFESQNSSILNFSCILNFSLALICSLNVKTVNFQNQSSIGLIDRTLSGAPLLGQNWPGSDGNWRVLHIPQSSSSTGNSPSYYLVSYPGHSLVGVYSLAEMQFVLYCPSRLGKYAYIYICICVCVCIYIYIYIYIYHHHHQVMLTV